MHAEPLGDRPADWSVELPVYSGREYRNVEIGGWLWISGSAIAGDATVVLVQTDLQHLSTRGDDAKLCVSCRRREDQLSGDNGKLVAREENWRGTSGAWKGGKGEVLRGSTADGG